MQPDFHHGLLAHRGGDERERMVKQTRRGKAIRRLRVTLVKSTIGYNRQQAAVVRGMGLRRLGHTVDLPDEPAARGMIQKVRHLVTVDETLG